MVPSRRRLVNLHQPPSAQARSFQPAIARSRSARSIQTRRRRGGLTAGRSPDAIKSRSVHALMPLYTSAALRSSRRPDDFLAARRGLAVRRPTRQPGCSWVSTWRTSIYFRIGDGRSPTSHEGDVRTSAFYEASSAIACSNCAYASRMKSRTRSCDAAFSIGRSRRSCGAIPQPCRRGPGT